jgi:hypothetical protein
MVCSIAFAFGISMVARESPSRVAWLRRRGWAIFAVVLPVSIVAVSQSRPNMAETWGFMAETWGFMAETWGFQTINALHNAEVGYSLKYPNTWHVTGQVVATEFAQNADCESVEIVDFLPPPGSGAAFVLHSFVQVCAQRLSDNLTLDNFMKQAYDHALLSEFRMKKLNGLSSYWHEHGDLGGSIFLQTQSHRVQISFGVVVDAEKRSERWSQVQKVLHSFRQTSEGERS